MNIYEYTDFICYVLMFILLILLFAQFIVKKKSKIFILEVLVCILILFVNTVSIFFKQKLYMRYDDSIIIQILLFVYSIMCLIFYLEEKNYLPKNKRKWCFRSKLFKSLDLFLSVFIKFQLLLSNLLKKHISFCFNIL